MLTRKALFGLAIALLATSSLVAQDNEMKAKKALERVKKTTTDKLMKMFAKAELTDEQKTQATAVVDKHIGSYVEARKAQESLLTEDHIAKRKAAMEKAKTDGLKKKEAYTAAFEAMGLTEEEKSKYDESKKKTSSVVATMRSEVEALLTDEQKAAMPKKGKKSKGKKGKDKKEMKDTNATATQAVSLKLPNMTWGGCARSVRAALEGVDGVADIKTNPKDNTCTFSAPEEMDVETTLNQIVEDGNKQIKGWGLVE